MIIDENPFPYLKPGQYAGRGFGEIVFLDDSIPEDKKEWLRKKYKEWWEKEKKNAEL